ncbi:MAG: response regulator [Proteobacteria bacterium]|nr:response regulator [Pseudomonadota bacterium]
MNRLDDAVGPRGAILGSVQPKGQKLSFYARVRDVLDTFQQREEGESERALVMIVDDEEFMRTALELAFQDHYDLILAASADEALRHLTDEVRVVVLDVKMRDKDGFWTYEAIRARRPYLPMIFYSAYEDLKEPYDIINRYRPYGYFFKGRDFQQLLEGVSSAVADYREILRTIDESRVLREIQGLMRDLNRREL